MNPQTFDRFIEVLNLEENKLLLTKGHDYTQGDEDRLINFKRIAKLIGLRPLQVWSVYFYKHIDSIMTYVKTDKLESDESLRGRFQDARNYLALGLALLEDSKGD